MKCKTKRVYLYEDSNSKKFDIRSFNLNFKKFSKVEENWREAYKMVSYVWKQSKRINGENETFQFVLSAINRVIDNYYR